MCGIAGFSLPPGSELNRTLLARVLLAGIAERGADAVGLAARTRRGSTGVLKQRTPASEFLPKLELAGDADIALLHVRSWTKGSPDNYLNNHPIGHGAVIGIHNGVLENDDELFARHQFERFSEVDSEAIFALLDRFGSATWPLRQLRGSCATAWLDERQPDTLFLARTLGRPLVIGVSSELVVFASTESALQRLNDACGLALAFEEIAEGSFLTLRDGEIVSRSRFRPAPSRLDSPPAQPSSEEARRCLTALLALPLAAPGHALSPS